jgi:basic membrane protein A and related proteins
MKARNLLVVLLVLAVLAAGCAAAPGTSGGAASGKPLRVAVVMPSAITDQSFSQSMWQALQTLQKDLGGPSAMEIKYTENMTKVPDAAAALRDYATQGFDIVIAHGSQFIAPAAEVAKDFPKVTFLWGTDPKTFDLPNVYAYTPAAEEGGYVQGVMAALLSKNKQIGVTGPVEVGDAKSYVNGFLQGVTATDPSVKVSKTWTGSFSDVALMSEAAKTHIAAGADVLTGSSQASVGSINAAKEKGNVLWFGLQADQASLAPKNVVSSTAYDWAPLLKQAINDRKAGKPGGQSYVLHLSNDGLKVAVNPEYKLPDNVKKAADAAIDGIKKGTIKVNP